jgi:threonine dehydrogenase-like Zn-dependent dehydrogenase
VSLGFPQETLIDPLNPKEVQAHAVKNGNNHNEKRCLAKNHMVVALHVFLKNHRACTDEKCDFKPLKLQRRALKPNDVLIDMKFCGICHTDLHNAAGQTAALGLKHYACVPGHELAGICAAVGSAVTKVKVGDQVGVGCMVDSCGTCGACRRGEEQKCPSQVILKL